MDSRLARGLRLSAIAVALSFASLGEAQELKTINFMSPNDSTCSVYPQFNADQLGFWKDEGIKVNMLASETTVPYVAFLQNGDADVVTLDAGQVLQAADTGLPVKAVYEAFQFAPEGIVVMADSPIKGLEDLKDVTIGLASDRDQLTTGIALDSIGQTMESANVTTAVVGDSGPVLAKSLQDGTIDAYAGGTTDFAGIEAAGMKLRNITPAEVSQNPANSFVVWGPTMEEKRDLITAFLRGWAKAQHAGVVDSKLSASVCRTHIPEQFENLDVGMWMINGAIYQRQLRRTMLYGELQTDVWTKIQGPYLKQKEISKEIDPATFLDSSFIAAANDWTTDDVKKNLNAWREANKDKLIN
jgi:NitT/TauT family transport system substrate-binding protein